MCCQAYALARKEEQEIAARVAELEQHYGYAGQPPAAAKPQPEPEPEPQPLTLQAVAAEASQTREQRHQQEEEQWGAVEAQAREAWSRQADETRQAEPEEAGAGEENAEPTEEEQDHEALLLQVRLSQFSSWSSFADTS